MKTLTSAEERAAVIARVQTLTPDSRRQWGRMTPHQAVCHLSDSFRGVMGGRPISPSSTIFSRTVVKWVALRAPMPWPHGVQTRPEVDQEIGGTKPGEFSGTGTRSRRSSRSSPAAPAAICIRIRSSDR